MGFRVLLVEPDRLMLEQLSMTISKTPGFELVARYQAASDALGQGTVFKPNIILLGVDGQKAPELIRDFRRLYPDVSIICMGEQWSADSAAHLVQAGARGYIIKPFTSDELRDAVEAFAKSGMVVGGETYTFFSPKGKSGKTTLIANLAMELARRSGAKVGIIDADLQFGDMAVFFSLSPTSTIVEAARDAEFLSPVTLASYFMPVTENVHVLCGTRAPNLIDRVSIASLERIIRIAQSLYQYLLIDVPPAFNPTSIAASELSTTTILVAMINGGYEIEHMREALEIFKDWPDYEDRVKAVFTRVTPCDRASQEEIGRALGFPVAGIIPNAYEEVSAAADSGRMAVDIERSSPFAQSVSKLVSKIMGRHSSGWRSV